MTSIVPPDLTALSALLDVRAVAAMLDCSPDTVRRTFRDRLVRISRRRVGIRLSDVLKLDTPPQG